MPRDTPMALAYGLALAGAAAVVTALGDPVLASVAFLALQTVLFPAMQWQTLALGALGLVRVFRYHDPALGDHRSFVVALGSFVNTVLATLVVLVACADALRAGAALLTDGPGAALDRVARTLPIAAALVVKYAVDAHTDPFAIDGALLGVQFVGSLVRAVADALALAGKLAKDAIAPSGA